MVLSPEQERVRTLLQDTITLLCRNGLSYQNEFDIKALIGITVDKENCFLIDIKDTIKNNANKDSDEENEDDVPQSPARKRKRNKRRRSSRGESDLESLASDSVPHTPVNNRVKAEEDEDSDDAIIIKDEPGYDNSNYGNNQDILGNLAQAQLFPATQESLQWDAGSPSFSIGSSQQQHHHQQSQHMNTSQNLGASTSTPSLQQQQQVNWCTSPALAESPAATPSKQQTLKGRGRGRPRKQSTGGTHNINLRNVGYKCSECDKTFTTQPGLKYHLDRHFGKYPYRCPYCYKGIHATVNLKQHIRKEHGGTGIGFTCIYCNTDFPQKGLIVHLEMCPRKPKVKTITIQPQGVDDVMMGTPPVAKKQRRESGEGGEGGERSSSVIKFSSPPNALSQAVFPTASIEDTASVADTGGGGKNDEKFYITVAESTTSEEEEEEMEEGDNGNDEKEDKDTDKEGKEDSNEKEKEEEGDKKKEDNDEKDEDEGEKEASPQNSSQEGAQMFTITNVCGGVEESNTEDSSAEREDDKQKDNTENSTNMNEEPI